jgi:hypothetical protein
MKSQQNQFNTFFLNSMGLAMLLSVITFAIVPIEEWHANFQEKDFTVALIALEVVFSLMILTVLGKAGASKSVLMIIGAVFTLWFAAAYTLLSQGFYADSDMPQLTFVMGVVIPVVLGYLAKQLWQPLTKAVDAMSTKTFLSLQFMRAAFGIMFFFTAALPVWFQYTGGLGDILAGFGAYLGLYYFFRNPNEERQAIIRGNLIGILDFIVVLSLGVFVVLQDHSPDMMFLLIPLYVVPLFILLHIFSLQRLGRINQQIKSQIAD